jgi:ribosomal protein L37AE/L43A
MKPLCVDCGETFSIRRRELGYRLCLTCGETEARGVKRCTVPLHKQGYSLVTNRSELKQLNPKRIGDG